MSENYINSHKIDRFQCKVFHTKKCKYVLNQRKAIPLRPSLTLLCIQTYTFRCKLLTKSLETLLNYLSYHWKVHAFPTTLQLVTFERRYDTGSWLGQKPNVPNPTFWMLTSHSSIQSQWSEKNDNQILTFPHWWCCWQANSKAIVTNKVSF